MQGRSATRFPKAFEIPQPEFLTHHPRRAPSPRLGDHARSSDECFGKAVASLGDNFLNACLAQLDR
ncbi:MAG: hypothetical protein A3C11_01930 [Candidatus Sungbacteria bacterium RIFCSPHIGHO2_02_FULL_49_12]|uniref:Uncharacterized protein n=1 Tax=Candidatus Sungbacteria bacterium RIFCSPHIGHO2_02_FULL_49_12 TaxID=1802271 RepID=A0A1G2KLB2_9BACT|nr:MAG: hypothetical protein A3C11_01930 [Candidatus Sungbacteria bacterium RIFCSPHIGHO2_02_FULL_49_12]